MATVIANQPLNMLNFNLNNILNYSYSSDFYQSPPYDLTYNNQSYKTALIVRWNFAGLSYGSYFLGPDITVSSFGAYKVVTGGTLTGYSQYYWNGTAWMPFWSIQNISLPATELYNDATTVSTADDYATILI